MRAQLAKALAWGEAHADFDKAVQDFPVELRGRTVPNLPYSAWQLLEHLRIAQHDILDFCRNPHYEEMEWPAAYWPKTAEPPTPSSWDDSVASFRRDREAMQQLATDPNVELTNPIPHGGGQTYLREVLLVLDHNAYHVAEIVLLRRLLGAWK